MRYKQVLSVNSDHIDYIVITTYNRLNIMRKSRTFLDRYSLDFFYISFIRPLMEYTDDIIMGWNFSGLSVDKRFK
jgi:hypothetical protein